RRGALPICRPWRRMTPRRVTVWAPPSGPPPRPPPRAVTRRCRSSRARAGPATSASAAAVTWTRVPRARRSCWSRQPGRWPDGGEPAREAPVIGLVVVSHSRALAEAAVGLASEMVEAGRRPAIEVAAGLDEHTFGTDAAAVAEAIDRADSGDGVVVLLDLGSAVLSAEMALEFVDPDLAGRVRLSSAPLVEGLVAATVAAAAGADLDTVAREAAGGLAAKQAHLEEAAPGEPAPGEKVAAEGETSAGAAAEPERTVVLEVTAEHGLHARPAAGFVQTVAAFPATVRVRNLDTGRGPVDARSLTSLATLDARQGHRIEVTADGDGAEEVLRALEELAGTQFGDAPGSEPQPGTAGAARPGPAARARVPATARGPETPRPPPARLPCRPPGVPGWTGPWVWSAGRTPRWTCRHTGRVRRQRSASAWSTPWRGPARSSWPSRSRRCGV